MKLSTKFPSAKPAHLSKMGTGQMRLQEHSPFRSRPFFILIMLLLAGPLSAAVRYVSPAGSDSNTGLSWGQAYKTIQKALEVAVSGDQIWVQAGTYLPTKDANGNSSPGNLRTKTFNLKSGVKLYGGFAGAETMLSQRDWDTNVTILSGDIGSTDVDTDNAYHVVMSIYDDGATEINGFTITKGNANGTADLTVEGGTTYSYHGGGLYQSVSSCTVAHCNFTNNKAKYNGGALINWFGNTTSSITNCNFSNNQVELQEGGAISIRFCTSVVDNCVFSGNTAKTGGGVHVQDDAVVTFSNCLFTGNIANSGAGVSISLHSTVTITNCTFSGNANNLFSPTVSLYYECSLTMKNSIIWNNMAINTVGNAASSLSFDETSTTSVSYSLVQGQTPAGTGNIDGITPASTGNFPGFVTLLDPSTAPALGGDFHLLDCSPLADVGTNTGVPPSDLDGETRPFGAGVDLGCYERQTNGSTPSTWYADTDGDGYGNPNASIPFCGQPNGYVADNTDCNDNNAAIKPGATEICDGIDNNCNSMIDEGALSTYYRDMDGDGFGDAAITQQACSAPGGYVANNTDCNDNSAVEKPGQVWYKDSDGDGYAQTGATTINQCLRPTGYKAASELTSTTGDCNDNNAAINPAATEICDGIDNNCNSMIDEGVLGTYYRDMDGDGFGDPAVTQMACSQPGGYVANNTDCNDNDPLEKPGQVWYKDSDGDGYAQTSTATITQCLRPTGYKAASELTSTSGDCNDNNAAINPAATEICDGVDNNCNSMIDEGGLSTYYRDMDGDGFGDPAMTQMACSQPGGYVANNDDCNDNSAVEKPGQVWYKDTDGDGYAQTGAATITQCLRPTGYKAGSELTSATGDCNDDPATGGMTNPAATEICDGVDNNCNSMTDEGVLSTYYRDMDGDGFGDPAMAQMACSQPGGYVANNTDCNDNSALEKPGQVWYKDSDGDGYAQTGAATITQCLRPTGYKAAIELIATTGDCNDDPATGGMTNPAATEICDGLDNNCDSETDEGVKTEYFADTDGDGYGDPNNMITECSQPVGYVTNADDCDDTSDEVHPGAEEICDSKDNDCNGEIDDIEGITSGSWSSADIGSSNGSGNYPSCNAGPNDVFTINATGFSTSSSDKIQAVYQELCGNGEIIARVLNVSGGGWAGIMLRETLDPGSKKTALKKQGNNNIRREIRTITNGAVSNLNYNRPQHVWLRLVRNGSSFVGYTSVDGSNWSYAFAATIPMNGCIYAGLFSESINANVTTTATFDNVQLIGNANTLIHAPQTPATASNLSLEVYPNPTSGEVNIDLSNYANPVGTVKVFDPYGKLVMQDKLDGSSLFHIKLDGKDSVYFLSIEVEGEAPVTKRVVIAH